MTGGGANWNLGMFVYELLELAFARAQPFTDRVMSSLLPRRKICQFQRALQNEIEMVGDPCALIDVKPKNDFTVTKKGK